MQLSFRMCDELSGIFSDIITDIQAWRVQTEWPISVIVIVTCPNWISDIPNCHFDDSKRNYE